jgi:hypothetical protein
MTYPDHVHRLFNFRAATRQPLSRLVAIVVIALLSLGHGPRSSPVSPPFSRTVLRTFSFKRAFPPTQNITGNTASEAR